MTRGTYAAAGKYGSSKNTDTLNTGSLATPQTTFTYMCRAVRLFLPNVCRHYLPQYQVSRVDPRPSLP